MNKTLAQFLTCAALVFGAASGHAAPVAGQFTLAPDFGSLPGAPVVGQFTWDDADPLAASGHGDQVRGLTAFTLRLAGVDYTLADLGDAFAVFDANGFSGLAVTIAGVLTLSPAAGGQDPFFAYSGARGGAAGDVRFAPGDAGVPEPATLAAALAALGAAALARRRRVRGC